MSNIITATFNGARTTRTEPLYQYDYGQVLQLADVELPAAYEVHFSNYSRHNDALVVLGNAYGAGIPDELLLPGKNIFAWVYLHTGEDDGETEYAITIPVTPRSKPEDYEPTPSEDSAIARALSIINGNAAAVESVISNLEQTIADAMLAAKRDIGGAAPPILLTESGTHIDIADGANGEPLMACVVDLSAIQAGTGDPSPTNVRPITGHSAVKITRAGVNLCPPPTIGNSYNNNTGAATTGTATNAATERFAVDFAANPTYTLTLGVNLTVFLYAWDAAGNYVGRSTSVTPSGALTVTKNTIDTPGTGGTGDVDSIATLAVRLYQGTGQSIADAANAQLMVVPGGTALTYEAYAGEAWQTDLGEAVYGGTLNVLAGTLTITHGYIASYDGESLPGAWISDRDVYAPGTTPTTGAQVVYQLAEPRTAQLTARQPTTILGVNHIDAGGMPLAIVYTADTKTYIDNTIAALIAAMI